VIELSTLGPALNFPERVGSLLNPLVANCLLALGVWGSGAVKPCIVTSAGAVSPAVVTSFLEIHP
jgi:hypothetical protein